LKVIDVGASDLSVNVNNGVLKASASQAALLGGSFKSTLMANTSTDVPTFGFSFNMKDVESKPVLAAFADFKNLSGKVDADIDVTARGKSQKEMIESLDGKGAATFKNGAFEGIDLVNIAKLLQQNLGDMGVGEGKTEFIDLGGTFTIAKGIATNKDLKMRGPLVQASGSGDIDLPKKFLRYRVIPVLTASSAVEGAKGISVPVDIKGPFSAIKVKPDYKSVIVNTLKDPSAVKDTIKNAQEQLKNIKNDPGAALEGLLGGRGLFGSKPKQPETAPEPEVSGETVPASP
jgi:AsmA protein